MIFNNEDKLYHYATNTCHICGKTCINKVGDHCHATGKNGEPACKMSNLRYKQQNFIPVVFHNSSGYDFILLFSDFLSRQVINEK